MSVSLSPDWLFEPGLQRLMAVLTKGGHRALVVGGAVRNAVMGLAPGDIDISTDARPERVQELAEAAGLRQVPTGIEHGTVTVIVDGEAYEITTFRRDVATDGRRAVVEFSEDMAEDALRRDFTMNALYLEADGTLVDPLQGLDDALGRRVRFIEDPEQRIREDYLRILRFFRFNAWYGQEIDPEGLAACAALAEGLETLSRERVGAEVLKLLAAPDPAPAMASFAATGGLMRILPGADVTALPVLISLEAGRRPDALRRLALIGGEDVAKSLRLSRAGAGNLALIRTAALEDTPLAEVSWRHGAEIAWDAALVRAALLSMPLAPQTEAEIAKGAAAKLPVTAADLMPALQGAALGAALKRIEKDWLASGLSKAKDQLLAEGAARRGDKTA